MKAEAWRANIAEAGLEETAELIEGDAFETLPTIDDVFDIVFIDAEKDDYERLFELARPKVEPGALFVADNVLSHEETLGAYSRARQADPTLESVTVPLDRGLELSVVLRQPDTPPGGLTDLLPLSYISPTAERRWSGSEIFKYGQWRYQRVGACP